MVGECLVRYAAKSGKRDREHDDVEAWVGVCGEAGQIVRGVAAAAQYGVYIDEVTNFGSAIERSHLVSDRIILVKHWADLEPDRWMGAPVDPHLDFY